MKKFIQKKIIPDSTQIHFKFNFRFNNLKASVPLHNSYSFIDQALVRPIVAFVNANSTKLNLSCPVVMTQVYFEMKIK